jgi:hypothetical protein
MYAEPWRPLALKLAKNQIGIKKPFHKGLKAAFIKRLRFRRTESLAKPGMKKYTVQIKSQGKLCA